MAQLVNVMDKHKCPKGREAYEDFEVVGALVDGSANPTSNNGSIGGSRNSAVLTEHHQNNDNVGDDDEDGSDSINEATHHANAAHGQGVALGKKQ
jgi:hypothetical protein